MSATLILDTEVNQLEKPEVIELAFAKAEMPKPRCVIAYEVETHRFKPDGEFECGAVAVHGILPDVVEHCRSSKLATTVLPPLEYCIAHNVDFDADALGLTTVKRIDTLAISRTLWPQFKCHKLTALMLELLGMNREALELISNAHGAEADVDMCAILLNFIMEEVPADVPMVTMDDLWMYSEECRIPTVMSFGKHKGELIADIPADYGKWVMKQPDFDPYVKRAFERVKPARRAATSKARS